RSLLLATCHVAAPENIASPEHVAAPQNITAPKNIRSPEDIRSPWFAVAAPERISVHCRRWYTNQELRGTPHSSIRPGRRSIPDSCGAVLQVDIAGFRVIRRGGRHGRASGNVVIAQCGFDVDVSRTDREHVVLICIGNAGGRIGCTAVSGQ